MNNEQLTVNQVIGITIDLLGNIAVPRNLNEQIGIPIDRAISNLRVCLEARMQAQQGTEEPDAAEGAEEPAETIEEEEQNDGNSSAE